jgi:hypothetical protein
MTQDEIIDMAREAGLETQDGFSESVFYFAKLVADKQSSLCYIQEQIAVKLACANAIYREREACAKSLENSAEATSNFQAKVLIEWCATHIRARGEA